MNSFDITLNLLENTKFKTCYSRKNVKDKSKRFCLGEVNYRGQKLLNYKTRGESKYNKKFPKLYLQLQNMINELMPNFKYTTIQLNKNVVCLPHIDKNNVGISAIIGLGNYTKGELVIEGKEIDIKNKIILFDGKLGH